MMSLAFFLKWQWKCQGSLSEVVFVLVSIIGLVLSLSPLKWRKSGERFGSSCLLQSLEKLTPSLLCCSLIMPSFSIFSLTRTSWQKNHLWKWEMFSIYIYFVAYFAYPTFSFENSILHFSFFFFGLTSLQVVLFCDKSEMKVAMHARIYCTKLADSK